MGVFRVRAACGHSLSTPARGRGGQPQRIGGGELRQYSRRLQPAIASIDLTSVHPVFTNDLDFGPNGDIYITDTGVHSSSGGALEHRGPDRIYRVSRDGQVTVALQSVALDAPDGIAWNPRGQDFLLAPIDGQAIQTWKPGQRAPVNLPRGAGKFDGIEVEHDGRTFITSWADSSVFQLHGTRLHRSIGPLDAPPADISLDQRNGRLGVVFLTANRFELWTLANETH